MLARARRGGAPARRALEEPALQQVGLVDVLDRVGLLADRDRERGQARPGRRRTACRRRRAGRGRGGPGRARRRSSSSSAASAAASSTTPVAAHLGPVAHALEQAVGDARRPAAARGDRRGAAVVERDAEDLRRAAHDPREVVRRVGLEAVLDPEAVAQRRRQQPRAGRGADERERRQVERHDLRPGALPDRDRQPPVLHRGVEGLLQRAAEAVDLVDEEHGARLERGQQRGDVALALERRAGGLDERDAELVGHDLRQRGLAEARRPGQQDVVERPRRARGRPASETASWSRTDSCPTNSSSVAGRSERSSSSSRGSSTPGVWMRGTRAHRRARAQGAGQEVLGRLARGGREQAVGLRRGEAELDEPVAGQPARVVGVDGAGAGATGDRVGVRVAERRDDLLAQLDDDPLGRALADARHGLQARDVAGRERGRPARAGAPPPRTASATFGPDATGRR